MILALQSKPEGSQLVVLKPTGSDWEVWESPGYVEGKTDRDPAWRPDGGTILFSSNREKTGYNMYRWNLMRNMVQRRSLGSRGQLAANFAPESLGGTNDECLITAGGSVQEFKAFDGTTRQILPPTPRGAAVTTNDETGSTTAGLFDAQYEKIGSSFREARWGKDRRWVIAVMRSEFGETLVVQDMSAALAPIPIISGDRINFDINPVSGDVAFSVLGLKLSGVRDRTPEAVAAAREDAKVRHRLGVLSLTDMAESKGQALQWIYGTKTDDIVASNPVYSPDGTTFAVVEGRYEGSGGVIPAGIVVVQPGAKGYGDRHPVAAGNLSDPSWSADGTRIAFIRNNGTERSVCTCSAQGGDERNLTAGKGNFSHPRFSPALKGK
jgi:hypothetical protein